MQTRFTGAAALFAAAGLSVWCLLTPVHVAYTPFVLHEFLRIDFGSSLLAAPFLFISAMVCAATAIWGLTWGSSTDGFRIALFSAAMTGVLLARSAAAFVLCWELMSLISMFLVATHHTHRSVRRAVISYAIVGQIGALCIIAALAILAVHARTGDFGGIASAAGTLAPTTRATVLLLAILGFGSKAGLVPLHFWLPAAHPAAPANASAVLSGVMLNIAVYGLLLACFVLAAPAPAAIGAVLLAAGLLSAMLGALYATIESEIKRLLAFSSIENVGIIVAALGLSLLASAAGARAAAALLLVAAIFHAVSHATFKGLLFLGAGTLVERLHVTNLDQLGGLSSDVMRRSAPWILIGCMAASALPPLSSFASEWLTFGGFIGAFVAGSLACKVAAAIGIVALALTGGLASAAFIKLYGTAFLGRERHARNAAPERFGAPVLAIALLGGACVLMGVVPSLIVGPASAIVTQVLHFAPLAVPGVPVLPALAALPLLGGIASFVFARRRGVREAGTWTCGSEVTRRSQYTATVLSKPLRLIFAFALFPQRERVTEYAASRWKPTRIAYALSTRYVFDEMARGVAAAVQRTARRTRVFQGGLLRVYLGYALAALLAALAVAR